MQKCNQGNSELTPFAPYSLFYMEVEMCNGENTGFGAGTVYTEIFQFIFAQQLFGLHFTENDETAIPLKSRNRL